MKKVIAVLMVLILFTFPLGGCATNTISEETTELEIWFVNFQNANYSQDANDLNAALEVYQSKYPEIHVNIVWKQLEQAEDMIEYYKQLGTTLMSGGGPDVLYMGERFPQENDIYKMQSSGAFLDLTELMEQDRQIEWNNYNRKVIEEARYQGKQYIMPLGYMLPIFMSTEEALAGSGFDPKNCSDLQGTMHEVKRYWNENAQKEAAPGIFSDKFFFNFFINYAGFNLADHENRTVNSDNPSLKEALDILKETYPYELERLIRQEANNELETDISKSVSGDMMMSFGAAKDSISRNYQATCLDRVGLRHYLGNISALGTIGEPVAFPLRDIDGSVQACVTRALMIPVASKNKANAWNFIKTCLGAEGQRGINNGADPQGIPVLKELWAEMYQSEFEGKSFSYWYKEKKYSGEPVEEKYFNQFVSWQDDIGGVFCRYPAEKIVQGKIEKYLNVSKDYEEMIQDVKGYLTIYLSE